MSDPGDGEIICIKNDENAVMEYGEVYEVVDVDEDTGRPIVDIPSEDDSEAAGVVLQKSLEGERIVRLKFSGVAKVKYSTFFGSADPGTPIGTSSGQKTAAPNATGLGTIIAVHVEASFGVPGFVLARLTGGGGDSRWKEYDP